MLRVLLVIWALMPSSAYAQLAEEITNAQGYISCNPCGFGAQTARRFPLALEQVEMFCQEKTGEPFIVTGGMTDASGHFDLEMPDNLGEFGNLTCYIQILDPQACTNINVGTPNLCPIIDTVTDQQLIFPAPSVPYTWPPTPFV